MPLPSLTDNRNNPDFHVLEINHAVGTAKIALHGAHIMEWCPAGMDPVLYMSPRSEFTEGKPIRGGIPICWPWFGAHPSDSNLPSHGLARTRIWKKLWASENKEGITVRLALESSAETLALWPYPFRLTLTAKFGKTLEVSLECENTGDKAFPSGGALHTYLTTGEISGVRVTGLDGKKYLDTVGERVERVQEGDVLFDREVDRIFRHSSGCLLIDKGLDREIRVSQSGSKDLVVWNPWIEKSLRLKDLPPEGYLGFVCLEAANCDGDLPLVQPGGKHVLGTVIEPL